MAAKVNMKTKTAALALALAQALSVASAAEPDPLDVLRRALQQRHIAAEPAEPEQAQTQEQKPSIARQSPDDYRMLERFMPDYTTLIAQAPAVESPDESQAEPNFEIIEIIQPDYQTLVAEAVALQAERAGAEQTAQAQPEPTTEPEIIHVHAGPWPEEPANPARRELWSETITLESRQEKTPSQSELQRTIARLRSVRFDSPAEREPAAEPEPQKPETEKEPQVAHAKPDTTARQISDQTLGQLAKLADQGAQIEQPLKIAELLYRDGHKQLAGRYYEIALTQSETMGVQDRPWALFQLGNCLRDGSPEKAIEAYKQLVSEYPRTTWAQAAAARIEVLEFKQQNQPEMTASSHRAN